MSFEHSRTKQRASSLDAPVHSEPEPGEEASFHRQSLGEIGSMVQRLAGGTEATSDLQQTAHAGVAGPGGTLPHLDAIQQSFGRHDVSGVSAHVGGDAADAADALGAHAYAAGDRVAFADQPDLRTAAHEAAHTVQQRTGVVSEELDTPGDHHEQEADRIADAVVAGESAEPLLDAMVGDRTASASSGSIQRESLDDMMKRDKAREPEVRTAVVRTSLAGAQYWLDSGAKKLRAGGDAKDAAIANSAATNAHRHLMEAWMAVEGGSKPGKAVRVQMDETSHAVLDFAEQVLVSSDATINHGTLTTPLLAMNTTLRDLLGLPDAPANRKHEKAKGSKDRYEDKAIGPVLELAEIEANQVYAALTRDSDQRDSILSDTSALGTHLGHALYLLRSHEGKDEAKTHKKQIEATSAAVLNIEAWIDSRQNNVALLAKFSYIVSKTTDIREHVGLGPLDNLEEGRLTRGARKEAVDEYEALREAEKNYYTAMGTAFRGVYLGTLRFLKYAELERPPVPPSFWGELAKGVVIAMIGNMAGPAMGILASKIASKVKFDMGESTLDYITSTTVDSVQAAASTLADKAIHSVRSANQDVRDRQLLAEGAVLTQGSLDDNAKFSVAARVKEKTISARELVDMTAAIAETQDTMNDLTYQSAAHAYAQLVAKQSIGKLDDDGNIVSDYDDYFGTSANPYAYPIIPSKEGRAGIAKLTVNVYDDGLAATEIAKFEIHGMNDDMALGVLQSADYELAKLDLPLEIMVHGMFWLVERTPAPTGLIVVDEAGTLQTSRDWDLVAQGPRIREKADNADVYSTPEKLWDSIRGSTVPAGAAKITPGG